MPVSGLDVLLKLAQRRVQHATTQVSSYNHYAFSAIRVSTIPWLWPATE